MPRIILLIALALSFSGCATTLRTAVPAQLTEKAVVVGLDDKRIRFWGDEPPKNLARAAREMRLQRAAAQRRGLLRVTPGNRDSLLAISGGGADGAFGAGFLNGWTTTGRRPEFLVVTGVSTGALMAPFAFLGPKYDATLRKFYTQYSTKDIITPMVLAGLLGGTSLASSEPLAELIAKYMTRSVMREIAAEHQKGRRLLIGTTNLDAQRPVIWNLGEIASVGTNEALRLMRQVLLASASIPGLFPPVLINVHAGGKVLQEMHVDGGTTDNAIMLPSQTNLRGIEPLARRRRTNLYVIVNLDLDPEWQAVKSSAFAIAGRSISTLIKEKTVGDLYKLYAFSQRNHVRFKLATVPGSFDMKQKEPFDRAYMTALFKVGEALGRKGYRWAGAPPIN